MAKKADVAEVKADVGRPGDKMAKKADVTEVKAALARLETRMFIAMLTAVGAIVALVKLLP